MASSLLPVVAIRPAKTGWRFGGGPRAGTDRSQAQVAGGRLLSVSLCTNTGLLWGACAQGQNDDFWCWRGQSYHWRTKSSTPGTQWAHRVAFRFRTVSKILPKIATMLPVRAQRGGGQACALYF